MGGGAVFKQKTGWDRELKPLQRGADEGREVKAIERNAGVKHGTLCLFLVKRTYDYSNLMRNLLNKNRATSRSMIRMVL